MRLRMPERSEGVSHAIVAELVGNVMSVVVHEGAPVTAGDTIVILESMKMEIPVLTEYDGVVRDLSVHVGEVVQEGDVLAVIDPVLA
ncbi:MAG: acetyl-CoA carboxylase biotin carboxyl carrier protein [Pseudonocardiales bacterium]|nr:acetyl-CoA carboxylase biotin carboxyl carrier protein [Pseudonocardiales bacterium]